MDNDTLNSKKAKWIKMNGNVFVCAECENEGVPSTNTVNGIEEADIEQVKTELKEFPNKTIYGICNVCGMEYTFKSEGDDLYLEESEELK